MIARDKLEEIGRFNKPHGVRGELSASVYDVDPADLSCILVEIEGLYVPFFITGVRTKGSETYLLTIKGIADENDGVLLANKTFYALADEVETDPDDADGFYLSDLIGYTVMDDDGHTAGEIEDFDDSTENVLFIVRRPGSDSTFFVPAAEDIITEINQDNKTIIMNLPIGLLDL
ncbi:MAG: ribosome maturation factor RimM [Muribaculaceae bacterium]|nr:ribosome maturation factor RimM [Muribaculaceae bacterium]